MCALKITKKVKNLYGHNEIKPVTENMHRAEKKKK